MNSLFKTLSVRRIFVSPAMRFVSLFFVCILGFFLRVYNLGFPSIGYHNMQENEYLSMAEIMRASKDFKNPRTYFDSLVLPGEKQRNALLPPLMAYQILLGWGIFGEHLWGPRLLNVIFATAGIFLFYLCAKFLFRDFVLAFFAAFLFAIMPVGVFFSRNLQPDTMAMFFMLLGNLFYLKFVVDRKKTNLLLAGAFSILAWFYKINFIFGAFAAILFLILLEYKNYKKKEFRSWFIFLLLPYLVFSLYLFWLFLQGVWRPVLSLDKLGLYLSVFTPNYWNSNWLNIRSYLADNFTLFYTVLGFLGLILAFLLQGGLLSQYLISWSLIGMVYVIFFANELIQQNFVQMPFLGMFCLACVFFVLFVAETIKKIIRVDLLPLIFCIVLAIGSTSIYGSIKRMHMTFFPGLEIAGMTLKEMTLPQERIFVFTHAQGYAIARYAQRYILWPKSLAEFKEKEDKYKVRFVCVAPAEYLGLLRNKEPEIFSYLEENYHLKELGFIEESRQLVYAILERGRGENLVKVLENFSGPLQSRAVYNLFGRIIFVYSIKPTAAVNN